MEIGQCDNTYYFMEEGTVTALNVNSGTILWENTDGVLGNYFMENDAIYACGYLTGSFIAISYSGETLCVIETFGDEYYWPHKIEVQDGEALICFECTYPDTVFRVNLDTWEYSIME